VPDPSGDIPERWPTAPFELKPEAEVWVKRRESWLLPVEEAAQHDENRP
jgi:hypothetical protein